MRILVIDDNELAAELLSEFVSLLGHDVSLACDGAQALALSRDTQPAVILSDIVLPDIDGYALAVQLRAQQGNAPLKIFALSGLPRHMHQPADESVFDAWLEKPVDLGLLETLLTEAAAQEAAR